MATVEIIIRRPIINATSFVLYASPNQTVGQLKEMIKNTIGVATRCQTLKFDGTTMENYQSLSSYGIYDGSSVSLTLLERVYSGHVLVKLIMNHIETQTSFSLDTSVAEVKESIRQDTCLRSIENIHLFLRNQEMMNGQCLSDFDISDGQRITVVLR